MTTIVQLRNELAHCRAMSRIAWIAIASTAAVIGCTKKDEAPVDTGAAMAPAPAAMDTGMKMVDSMAVKDSMMKDSVSIHHPSLTPPATIADTVTNPADQATRDSVALARQFERLRTASVDFQTHPDTFFIGKPGRVLVTIDPTVQPSPPASQRGVRPARTRVTTRTEVCLVAPGFEIKDDHGKLDNCREQVIPFTTPSTWTWIITAQPEIKVSGDRPVDITVNALLEGFPNYTVYTTSHTAYVYVEPQSAFQRLIAFVEQFKVLVVAIGAIVAAIVPLVKWLRSRSGSATKP